MRRDRERLQDIIDAIEAIERHVPQGIAAFRENELLQVWVVHHIEIIGEAVRSLSPELLARHSAVPWAGIVAMRNVLVHQYFNIDVETGWRVIGDNLVTLKHQVEAIMADMPEA